MAVIRVSGNLGSGKTTICNQLAIDMGYENHYTGNIFRQMAKNMGLSIEAFYKQLEENPELEKEVDEEQSQLMQSRDGIIVQGRIAPFLPWNPKFQKINVFLKVSDLEGAKRQLLRKENVGLTLNEMLRLSRERTAVEKQRYKSLYPHIVDHLDESKFDIVIDTTFLNLQEAYGKTYVEIKNLITRGL